MSHSRLNSREARRSEVFFSSGSYGLKVIERTHRRAAAEVWNVPQVCTTTSDPLEAAIDCKVVTNLNMHGLQIPDDEPTSITIRVTTELEDERNWHGSNENCSQATSSMSGYTI